MKSFRSYLLVLLCSIGAILRAQNLTISGKITDAENGRPVRGATVRLLQQNMATQSDEKGNYTFSIPYAPHIVITVSHLSYSRKSETIYPAAGAMEVTADIFIRTKSNALDTVAIHATHKPDTLVRSGRFSIYDFDFYEDKFILLTAEKGMDKAELKLATEAGGILYTLKVPAEAGKAIELSHDYMDYTNLICEFNVYRIIVYNSSLLIFSIRVSDYNSYVKPVTDSLSGKLFFSDYWKDYPAFSYYSYAVKDSARRKLITISNDDLLNAYNFEYYSMKSSERLVARKLADEYKMDEHVVAALMTGFTKSMYYEPLYAPLFIVGDTICIFDHYKDLLFHFRPDGTKIDSVHINYNHPKNWHEWKRQMVKDETEKAVYAIFNKNGHKYLRRIDHQNGKNMGRYTLQFHSADKIRIKDGYAYYVYRPFESTQEKFLYRELITLNRND